MDAQFINDTAKYIMTVIKASQAIYYSWGSHSFKAIIYKDMAALQFTVNGFLHKGDVIIAYNGGADLFELYLLKKSEVKKSMKRIYVDELVKVIDSSVEKNTSDNEYKKIVHNEYCILE
jgi:hypothetical protein